MELTEEQQQAVDAFASVYSGDVRRLVLGGLAGTGKSVVVSVIAQEYPDVAVCAPTGKAAHVLRVKGIDDACTLHSLIYTPRGYDREGNVIFKRSGAPMPRVVIVDEASMLSAKLVADLERLIPHVLYVGDHGQLEPIGDDPGLMLDPDIKLERIHRQAEGSAIVQFAHHVRRGYEPRTCGPEARVQSGWSMDLLECDVVIVGYNESRCKVNDWFRSQLLDSPGPLPQPGEKVICLRNHREYEVWNGMTAVVTEIDANARRISVDTDDGPRTDLLFNPAQFGAQRTLPYVKPRSGRTPPSLWDFAYAVTCHKFQGSSAANVAVVDEVAPSWSGERWRYTAATRASERLTWVYK